jgi:hypothetical protein
MVSVEVSKEVSDLGDAVLGLVTAIKTALADGFQITQDVPSVVMAAISEVPKAMDAMSSLKGDLSQNPKESAMAAAVLAGKLLGLFLEPNLVPPQPPAAA